MVNNRRHNIIPVLLTVALLAGCAGQYTGAPRVEMMNYQSSPTYGHIYDVAYSYAESINAAIKADTLHPGMYADYGIALVMMGHRGEGCRMLNAEAKCFPQSRMMVRRIKQQMLPEMVDDTLAPSSLKVDMVQLDGWAYDSIASLRPLPAIATVIDSTDTARIRLQTPVDSVEYPIRLSANQKREMLAEEQRNAESRRKFVEDSIASAKQAAVDARKQAQVEKQKARKKLEKQKKREAKEKAKRREQERKQRTKERKQQQAAKQERRQQK